MGKKKKKVAKLTEEQYNAYIMSIKEASAHAADNEMFAPPDIRKEENKKN